ncbi:MAG: T9SS type A sorting domain-containing protein, partial [Bacteroidetes bacterium]|nr:T9SS type A sorting domain-containing protein [Bacteroidota bacterium]
TDETDTIANNSMALTLNDTTFARDDSVPTDGVGLAGISGTFGNMFELTQPDVLTTVSFFLTHATVGDSVRAFLWGFGNDFAGYPDTSLIDSSEYFIIPSDSGWFNIHFTCQSLLPPGQYFIGIQQVSTNHLLGLGFDKDTYHLGTSFVAVGTGSLGWAEMSLLPDFLCSFMIRLNFGRETQNASVIAVTDHICLGNSISLTSTGSGTFNWTGPNLNSMTGDTVIAMPMVASVYHVSFVDSNGCASSDSILVDVSPPPSVSLDSTIAFFGIPNGTASAMVLGGIPPYSYAWSDPGNQDSSTAVGLTPGTYTVTVMDSVGCVVVDSVLVSEATTQIDNLSNPSLISLYPNPTSGKVTLGNLETLGTNSELAIRITDLRGSLIYSRKVNGQNTTEVLFPSHAANGVYLLEIRAEEDRVVKRVYVDR